MAGIGCVGSRINFTRSPAAWKKYHIQPPPKSISTEPLFHSRETLAADEDRYLFPTQQESTDLGNYGTIQQIREFKQESTGLVEFVTGSFDLICSTIVVRLLILLMSGIPLSMLIVGGTYRTECPKEQRLPLYLLVGGGFGLIKIVFIYVLGRKSHSYDRLEEGNDYDDDDDDTEDVVLSRFVRFSNIALTMFLIIWFIFGNIWFYSIWKPNFKQPLHEPNNWCDQSLYWYTFYNFIVCYGLAALIFLLLFAITLYYIGCCKRKSGVI